MLLRGEALIGSVTMGFTVHGESGQWNLSVRAPGHIVLDRSTEDEYPYALLHGMLMAALDSCRRTFPERFPPLPEPAPIQRHKVRTSGAAPMNRNDICDQYETDINEIIDAWLPPEGPWPNIYLFDADGQLWPIPAHQMGRADIIRYVEDRYGSVFAHWTARNPALTEH